FYIIVGGFRDEANAFGHAKKLRESGLSATVLYNEEKEMHYVSVKTCATREEAMAARTDIRDNKKMDCWIYTK
ncbi:MAG: SPOR domain-containing protein, partial [Bacteroidales bacterium]|nr:SPOR domain-containing protein [Bacteroidales bacterium]